MSNERTIGHKIFDRKFKLDEKAKVIYNDNNDDILGVTVGGHSIARILKTTINEELGGKETL